MIEVKAGVTASRIVTNPLAVLMYVRGLGMAFAITVAATRGFGRTRGAVRRLGPVLRDESVANFRVSASVLAVLRQQPGIEIWDRNIVTPRGRSAV